MSTFDDGTAAIADLACGMDRASMAADSLGGVFVVGHDPGGIDPSLVVAAVNRERGVITVVSGPPVVEDESGIWVFADAWATMVAASPGALFRVPRSRSQRAARRARMARKRRRGYP